MSDKQTVRSTLVSLRLGPTDSNPEYAKFFLNEKSDGSHTFNAVSKEVKNAEGKYEPVLDGNGKPVPAHSYRLSPSTYKDGTPTGVLNVLRLGDDGKFTEVGAMFPTKANAGFFNHKDGLSLNATVRKDKDSDQYTPVTDTGALQAFHAACLSAFAATQAAAEKTSTEDAPAEEESGGPTPSA